MEIPFLDYHRKMIRKKYITDREAYILGCSEFCLFLYVSKILSEKKIARVSNKSL
jgi:hypothetical protein